MSRTADELLTRYRNAGVLVDTNLLLLFFVGAFRKSEIGKFKRTVQYTAEDFDKLVIVLHYFQKLVTTPHILTEVSNLAGQLAEHSRTGFFDQFRRAIELISEEYTPGSEIAATNEFARFGITDAAIVRHAKSKYLVLTDDFRLSQYLQANGADALNFNHIRRLNWF